MTVRGLLLLGLRSEEEEEEEASSSRRLALAVCCRGSTQLNQKEQGTRARATKSTHLSAGLTPLVLLVLGWSLRDVLHYVGQ